MRDAVVERRTEGEAVVQAEDLVGVGSLQRGAERVRGGVGPVVLANNLGRREGVCQLLIVQAVRSGAVLVTKQGRVGSTWLHAIRTRICVLRVLAEGAVVGIAVDGPGRRHVKPTG